MQFLALSALVLTLVGRCLAEPIPVNRDDLVARTPLPPLPFNFLPANDPNALWPCFRCVAECAIVVAGCTAVCVVTEVQPELCGVSDRP